MKSYSLTIQTEVITQYFLLVLFLMLYKVDPTSESMHEILKCDHSAIEENFPVVRFYYAVQGGSNF